MSPDTPPPVVGEPLPRAAEAHTAPEKWDQWILAERGHGWEWAKVFRVGPADVEEIWRAIAKAVLEAPITAFPAGSRGGVVELLDDDTAMVEVNDHAARAHARPDCLRATGQAAAHTHHTGQIQGRRRLRDAASAEARQSEFALGRSFIPQKSSP